LPQATVLLSDGKAASFRSKSEDLPLIVDFSAFGTKAGRCNDAKSNFFSEAYDAFPHWGFCETKWLADSVEKDFDIVGFMLDGNRAPFSGYNHLTIGGSECEPL
jgi:hypothetical protein